MLLKKEFNLDCFAVARNDEQGRSLMDSDWIVIASQRRSNPDYQDNALKFVY